MLVVTDGLLRECTTAVAGRYPESSTKKLNMDAMTALLIREPGQFDVILTTNMFGDILSGLCSELSGSLGMGGLLNAGKDIAFAQAQHGSAPNITGNDIANQMSLISSCAMLFEWLGERRSDPKLHEAAAATERAPDAVFADPKCHTADLGCTMHEGVCGADS